MDRIERGVGIFHNPSLAAGALSGFDGLTLAVVSRPGVLAEASNFDRIVVTDPRLGGDLGVWRTIPFPVDDSRFRDVEPHTGATRIALDGEPTEEREGFLRSLGLDELPWIQDDRDDYDVVIHLYDYRDADSAERVSYDIAAGRLVIADRERPRHDLVSGIHYVEARSGWHLGQLVYDLRRWPDNHDVVRMRARRQAERSRASALYARLVDDLYRDLAAFGSERPKT